MIKKLKETLMFWRWTDQIRSLQGQLAAVRAEHEALKAEHKKVLDGQVKLLAWVETTHRLRRAPEGIRAMIQSGRRIVPLLLMLFVSQCLFAAGPPPALLRNSWTTNTAGTPVAGVNDLSITNVGSGTNWLFYGITPQTVARLGDITGGTGLSTNGNQFLGVPLSIKSGAFLTNVIVESSLKVSNGFVFFTGPVTNNTQFNLPHLTVSRSAIINAQGDLTNSSADSNWSLYPTNVWNDRQFGSINLTNWSLIPTGAMAAFNDLVWTNDTSIPAVTLSPSLRTNIVQITNDFQSGAVIRGSNFVDRYNIRWWGADNTGVTNASQAISNAMAWIGANRLGAGTLYFPEGTYLVNQVWITNRFLTILGDGPGATTFHSSNAATMFYFASGSIRIENANFQGHGTATQGINLTNSEQSIIRNVVIDQIAGPGVFAQASSFSLLFDRLRVVNSHIGVHLTNGFQNSRFSSCLFYDNTNYQVVLGSVGTPNFNVSIQDSEMEGSSSATNLLINDVASVILDGVFFETAQIPAKDVVVMGTTSLVEINGMYSTGMGVSTNSIYVDGSLNKVSLNNSYIANYTTTPFVSASDFSLKNDFLNGLSYPDAVGMAGGYTSIGHAVEASVWGVGINSTGLRPSSISDAGFFGDGGNTLINYKGPGSALFITDSGSNYRLSVGRNGTAGFVGIGIGLDTPAEILTVRGNIASSGSLYQSNGIIAHQSIVLTNYPGQQEPFLRLSETNGRGYTEFTTTNSVIATNRLVFSFGSNTVAAGQVAKIHSTAISAGINNIVLTNDTGGGTLTFADLLWTNEPAGRIHPTTFTNRLEVQWPITVGTNSQLFGGPPDSNDIFFAYRSITNGEGWQPRFEFGSFSNSIYSSISATIAHRASGWTLTTVDENGNTSGAQLFARAEAGLGGDPEITLTTTNSFVPFSSRGATNTIINNVTYQFPPAQGSAGSVLTNNGSGALGWGAAASSGPSFSDLVWTNKLGTLYPLALSTNIIFNPSNTVSVASLARATNFLFQTSTRRIGGTNVLLAVFNGGASAFVVSDQGIMIGSTNYIPVPQAAIDIAYDTAFGVDTPDKSILLSSYHSVVGYSGNAVLGVNTNQAHMSLNANKEGTGQIQFTETTGGDPGFTNFVAQLFVEDTAGTFVFPYTIDPSFSLSPTGYYFGSSQRITNIHTLLSLHNSNTPVFQVDGIGDLKMLKRVAYSWPSSQGSAKSVLTNDGAGALGWSLSMAELTWANAISNLAQTKQFGTATLTNLSGTGAITNLYNLSLSNATIKPTVFGGVGTAAAMTNATGQLYGLEAGGNVVLTPNGSNITIQATLSGGGYATNANQFGAQITLTLKDGIFLTNIIAFPSSTLVNPGLTVTNVPGIGTNNFQVLNTNGVPVIFSQTNSGITLVASNVNFLGPQTNTSALNVAGGVTNWASVDTRGSVTNASRLETTGGVTNWAQTEAKGTLYASSNLWVKAGQGTSNAWVGGRIFIDASTQTTNHSAASGGYTNLFTYTVPGNTLTNTGDELEFYLSGMMRLQTATTNGLKCIYGSQTIFDTGLITASNCPWAAKIKITRTGLSSQRVEASVLWNVNEAISSSGNGTVSSYGTNLVAAQANGATNIFVFQGQSRLAAAVTNDYRVISYWPGLN